MVQLHYFQRPGRELRFEPVIRWLEHEQVAIGIFYESNYGSSSEKKPGHAVGLSFRNNRRRGVGRMILFPKKFLQTARAPIIVQLPMA